MFNQISYTFCLSKSCFWFLHFCIRSPWSSTHPIVTHTLGAQRWAYTWGHDTSMVVIGPQHVLNLNSITTVDASSLRLTVDVHHLWIHNTALLGASGWHYRLASKVDKLTFIVHLALFGQSFNHTVWFSVRPVSVVRSFRVDRLEDKARHYVELTSHPMRSIWFV